MCLVILASGHVSHGDPFINLRFDSPNTNSLTTRPIGWPLFGAPYEEPLPTDLYFGSTSDLLPGWTLHYGTNLVSTLTLGAYKTFLEIGTAAALVPYTKHPSGNPDYWLVLESRTESAPQVLAETGLSYRLTQRGDIPTNAQSVSLYASNSSGGFVR